MLHERARETTRLLPISQAQSRDVPGAGGAMGPPEVLRAPHWRAHNTGSDPEAQGRRLIPTPRSESPASVATYLRVRSGVHVRTSLRIRFGQSRPSLDQVSLRVRFDPPSTFSTCSSPSAPPSTS